MSFLENRDGQILIPLRRQFRRRRGHAIDFAAPFRTVMLRSFQNLDRMMRNESATRLAIP
jgi:hypothetical protein